MNEFEQICANLPPNCLQASILLVMPVTPVMPVAMVMLVTLVTPVTLVSLVTLHITCFFQDACSQMLTG